mgnify:CR=1 FL=1
MCAATLPALDRLAACGLPLSASVMVPCPWFPAVATWCRAHPRLDMGVHLTLTCEWRDYRWGPVSTRDPRTGLLDPAGYFHATYQDAVRRIHPAAAARELAAQVTWALAAGIRVSHLDDHMGVIHHPKFQRAYSALARRHKLAALLLKRGWWAGPGAGHAALFDHAGGMPLDRPADRLNTAKRALDALPPGLTHFFIHPAAATPELRAIAPDWRARVADLETFSSPAFARHLRRRGIRAVRYRELRAALWPPSRLPRR